jgi:uncharacterized protein (DUF1800 family)
MGGTRNRGRATLAAFASAVLLLATAAASGQEAPPNTVYEYETSLAPVCVDGSFPLTIEVPGAHVEGTLVATTDAKGKVVGTFTADGRILQVTGRVKFRSGVNDISLVMKDFSARVSLRGSYENFGAGVQVFSGTTRGKGDVAPGPCTFTLDVSSAPPTVARVEVVLPPHATGRLAGAGTVQVCGPALQVTAVRTMGKALRLTVKGGGFVWTGSGPPGSEPGSAQVTWTARGFGAKVSGAGLPIETVPPPSDLVYGAPVVMYEEEEPIAPNAPTTGGGPVREWSIDPPLPEGLAFDPATGVVTGTPEDPSAAATYTVTASNLAGDTQGTIDVSVRLNHAYSWAPETRTLSLDDQRHFLGRTHMGVRGDELAALQANGLDATIDDMLIMQSGTAIEAAAFAELVNPTDPPGLEGGFPYQYQQARWWERIMRDTDRPFQEVMAFFWHDHMPTSYNVLGAGYTHFFTDYANLLRHEATGNFRNLMLSISRDQSMLIYLDGYANSRFRPNENYAREFWELFTLGVDQGYTQADIVQSAKAFTGWQFRYDAVTTRYYMQFNPVLHDSGPKTFFGVTIPGQNTGDDFAAVVDITLAQRPVDRFVTKKIFEFFCYEAPPESLVDAMAADLRGSGWELKPFLRNLFRSEAFFSKKSMTRRAKNALEYTIGLQRTTGLDMRLDYTDYFQSLLGQRPGDPPTVNGWPLGTFWFSAASMVNRTNTAWYIMYLVGEQTAAGINVADILPPVAERTAPAVVDTVAGLMRVPLTVAERTLLIDYLNTQRQANGTVIASPFNGASQQHLDERVRGLIYILAQNPWHQVK